MYYISKIYFVKEIKTSAKESTKSNQRIQAIGWLGPEQFCFQKTVKDQIWPLVILSTLPNPNPTLWNLDLLQKEGKLNYS